jgi:hypothetical protein
MVTGLLLQVVKMEKSIRFLFPFRGLPNSRAHLDRIFAKAYFL